MTKNDELMPCPFCGGKAKILEWFSHWNVYCPHSVDDEMRRCDFSPELNHADFDKKEDAIKAWNARAEHKAVDVEEIKQFCLADVLKGRSREHKDIYYQIISEAINYANHKGYLRTPPVPQEDAQRALSLFDDGFAGHPLELNVPDEPSPDASICQFEFDPEDVFEIRKALTAHAKPDRKTDGCKCVSCSNPSDRETPDGADMCHECFGDFNATEYDNQKEVIRDLAGALRDIQSVERPEFMDAPQYWMEKCIDRADEALTKHKEALTALAGGE